MDWAAIGAIATIIGVILAGVNVVIVLVINRSPRGVPLAPGSTDPQPKTPSEWRKWLRDRWLYVRRGFRLKAAYHVGRLVALSGPENKPELRDERNMLNISIGIGETLLKQELLTTFPSTYTEALSRPFESAEHFLGRLLVERDLVNHFALHMVLDEHGQVLDLTQGNFEPFFPVMVFLPHGVAHFPIYVHNDHIGIPKLWVPLERKSYWPLVQRGRVSMPHLNKDIKERKPQSSA